MAPDDARSPGDRLAPWPPEAPSGNRTCRDWGWGAAGGRLTPLPSSPAGLPLTPSRPGGRPAGAGYNPAGTPRALWKHRRPERGSTQMRGRSRRRSPRFCLPRPSEEREGLPYFSVRLCLPGAPSSLQNLSAAVKARSPSRGAAAVLPETAGQTKLT